MELKVYGIKNCNTMKKTFDFLNEKGVEYTFTDYKKEAPDANLLVMFADKVGFEKLINKKGMTYRKLSEEEKEKLADEKEALNILSQKSSMIKRPIIQFPDEELVLGFEPEQIEAKL
jgi:Spx/MgsR family transcriptional regulator